MAVSGSSTFTQALVLKPRELSLRQGRKKRCKTSKCSKWKGGRCVCGKE